MIEVFDDYFECDNIVYAQINYLDYDDHCEERLCKRYKNKNIEFDKEEFNTKEKILKYYKNI